MTCSRRDGEEGSGHGKVRSKKRRSLIRLPILLAIPFGIALAAALFLYGDTARDLISIAIKVGVTR